MLGSLILYLIKGMRTIMFQLSGFYCKLLLQTDLGRKGLLNGFYRGSMVG